VLATSIGIILLFSIALAALINKLYLQNSMAAYSRDLASQIPMVMAQLSRDGLIRADQLTAWIQSLDPSSSDYMSVLCTPENHTLWTSRDVKAFEVDDICALFPSQATTPQYLSIAGFKPSDSPNHLYVLRNVGQEKQQLANLETETWFYISLLFFSASALVVAACHWSFSPLRRLAKELIAITESRQQTLDSDYPDELQDLTQALNQMITQREKQKVRYRHAMDDLAHSLKTRLAATNALLDDNSLSREQLNKRILEQVSQMDDMVQYQLKRALVGQRGLKRDDSSLTIPVDSLTGMLDKAYRDKPVTVTRGFADDATLPLHRSDLMELLGNLLENAYRFCLEQVLIRLEDKGDAWQLSIEDDGPGVPECYRESIFQRGVRADQLNPGTGIGLAVCDEIIASYDGTIQVTQSSLQGAAFVLTLPKR
jgi:two-component system sensor histidine kinase PhoQ